MAHKFAEIAFTSTVKQVQEEMGSRTGYSSIETGPDRNNLLRDRERVFIEARDSFTLPVSAKPVGPTSSIGAGQPDF